MLGRNCTPQKTSITIFFEIYFICVSVCTSTWGDQKRASDLLELEVEAFM